MRLETSNAVLAVAAILAWGGVVGFLTFVLYALYHAVVQ